MTSCSWPFALRANAAGDIIPLRPDGQRDVIEEIDANDGPYKLLEAALKAGKTKAIGVSNWSIPRLEDLLARCEIKPAVKCVLPSAVYL